MGRSPCCDKVGLKKGPWTPEEDQKLLAYIEEHGHGSWRALPSKAGLQRCGKSCRLRWTNYLRPDIKRGKFSLQEEQTIIQLHALLGNRWSAIATHLAKRTDNEIKNYWNTHLKKRLTKMGIDPVSHKPKNDALLSNDGQTKSTANLSHMAQWESARLEAEARLVKQSKLQSTSPLGNQVGSLEPSPIPVKLLAPTPSGAPTRCLDVLKAWNGVWGGKPNDAGGGNVIGDLESPTSTLSTVGIGESSTSFFEFVVGHSSRSYEDGAVGDQCEDDWEYKDGSDGMHKSTPFSSGLSGLTVPLVDNNTWTTSTESPKPRNDHNEHVAGGNFLKSFTDLLLSNSGASNHGNFVEGGADNDNDNNNDNDSDTAPRGNNNGRYDDNNKNYWNNILNLVNSTLPDSPLF